MKRTVRSAFSYAAALILASAAVVACGELTGPESPSTPTDVKAVLLTVNSAKVTWTPSPLNDGVISYSIYRNGNKVGESTTTDYTDTGLAQQTTYVYSVAANCKGGVVSDRSAETAQSTITTIDITPPTVSSHQPPTNFVGVSSGATVTATFSEPMDPSTINATTFNVKVTSSGVLVPGTVTYNTTTRVAEFTSTGGLPNPVSLTATVTTGAKDLAGNALAAPFAWAFTTRDDTAPTVSSTVPANASVGASPSAPITITFSEALDATTVNATNITVRTTIGGTSVAGAVTYNAATRTATFTPTASLAQTTGYTVTVSTGIKDAAGNAMAANFVFSFTTGDTTAPTVTTVVPANNATGIATNTTVKVTFSEVMDASTINGTTVTLKNTGTSALVTATVTYDGATNTATLTPSAALAGNTNYTVTVTTGAKDVSGNGLAADFISKFTTLNPDNTPPTVTAVSPLNGAINVPTNTTVQVTFSEPMDQLTLSTTTISLKNTGTSAVVAGTLTYDVGTNKAIFTPSGPLSNATGYTLTVLSGATGVKDLAGNPLAANFNASFTTSAVTDVTPPTIVGRSPASGATGVAVNSNVTVTFSEPMDPSTINGTTISIKPTAGGANLTATVVCDAGCTTATLNPAADLLNNTSYTVTVTTGVKDVAGNALAAQSAWSFTTAADVTPPTITGTTPTNGAVNVAVGSTVTVTFSEDMDPTTINGTTFTLKTTVGSVAVVGTVSYLNRVATFTPSAPLAANTSYTATVTTGAKDLAGNALAVGGVFSFTTAP